MVPWPISPDSKLAVVPQWGHKVAICDLQDEILTWNFLTHRVRMFKWLSHDVHNYHMIHIQCSCDYHMIHIQCSCDHMIHIQCSCDYHMVHTQCSCDITWYTYNAHVVITWYTYNAHVITWYIQCLQTTWCLHNALVFMGCGLVYT